MNSLLEALGYLGDMVDKPGRAVRGLLGGHLDEGLAAVPFSDSLGLTDRSRAVSGSDLLNSVGANTGNSVADSILGFGAEVALDPTNLFGGFALKGAAGAAKAAKATNATRASLLAKGAMPAEIAKLTSVVDDAGKPLRTYHGSASAYDKIDPTKFDTGSLYGPGYYTTADPSVASEYATAMMGPQAARPHIQSQIDGYQRTVAQLEKDLLDPYYHAPMRQRQYHGIKPEIERVKGLAAAKQAELDTLPPLAPNVRTQFLDIRNPLDIDANYNPARAAFIEDFQPHYPVGPGTVTPSGETPGEVLFKAAMNAGGGSKTGAVDFLRSKGFDGIRHTGGHLMGGVEHPVHIAFDPSQVYKPWLAPAEQDVPSLMPYLAGLAGYNTARPFRQEYPR